MIKRVLLAAAAVALSTGVFAAPASTAMLGGVKILADEKGVVLYTYDKDVKGAEASACNATCAVTWPPFAAVDTDKPEGAWTIIKGLDAAGLQIKQWAFKGMPVYYYVKDGKPGEATGDGAANGVWHVVRM